MELDLPPQLTTLLQRLLIGIETLASGPPTPPLEPWSPERLALLHRLTALNETAEGITEALNDLPGPQLPQVDVVRKMVVTTALTTGNRRTRLKDAISEERDAVIVETYPTAIRTDAILARVNALPGPAFTRPWLYARAAQLNLMRPAGGEPPPAPVGQAVLLP